jgi:hypothetical protein
MIQIRAFAVPLPIRFSIRHPRPPLAHYVHPVRRRPSATTSVGGFGPVSAFWGTDHNAGPRLSTMVNAAPRTGLRRPQPLRPRLYVRLCSTHLPPSPTATAHGHGHAPERAEQPPIARRPQPAAQAAPAAWPTAAPRRPRRCLGCARRARPAASWIMARASGSGHARTPAARSTVTPQTRRVGRVCAAPPTTLPFQMRPIKVFAFQAPLAQ